MSDDSNLIVYDEGSIRHIRFNRPERLNAIDLMQHDRVLSALHEANADATVRVVVFSGEGRAYCAGDDLKAGPSGESPEWYKNRHQVDLKIGVGPLLLQKVTTVIRDMGKPTVVLMHGYGLGAGYDYATSCDFRVSTEGCIFGDPRIKRAMWSAEGWSYKTPRLIPQTHITNTTFTGEALTGKEAYRIGLVHRLYPNDQDLRESASEFLLELTELNPERYRWTKKKLHSDRDLRYLDSLNNYPR